MKILKNAVLLSLLAINTNSFAALNDGLVAYWSFDDCTAKDNSGNGHDGTINGNPQCINGIKGKGFYFDGQNDYINVPLTQDLQTNPNIKSFSLSGWAKPIKMNIFNSQYSGFLGVPLMDTYTYFLSNWGFEVKRNAYTAEGGSYTDNPLWDKDNWHFFSGVWKINENKITANYYVDGVLKATKNFDVIPNGSYPWNGLFIGATAHLNGGRAEFFGDELRIYNRPLTDSEIKTLYQQGTTPTITSITPTVAILNQQTTFTVTGTHLTDNMGFTIGDCDSNNQPVEIGIGTETQRQFQCTPRGTAGEKIGYIKTKPQGERLLSFTTKIQPSENIPIIIDVNPKIAELNKPTEFTITGGNLTTNMGFTIADCDASNNEIISKATPLSRTFICTPRGTVGRKVGIIKTAPQELSLHYFDVQITAPKMPKLAQTKMGALTNQSEVKTINLKDLSAVNDTTLTVNNRLKSQIALWKLPTIIKVGSVMRKVESYLPSTQGIILTVSIPTEEEWLSQLNFNGKTVLTSSSLPEEEKESNPTLKIKALRQSELNPQARKSITITDNKNVFKFSFTNHVLYDVDGDTNTQFDQLLVNGDITIDKPTVTFNYSKSLIPLKMNASVKYLAGESFNLVYSSQELKFQFTNAKQPIKLATFAFPIPVTSGTVYGNLTLYLVYDINGQAQISAVFNQEAKIDLGFSVNADSNKVVFDKWNKSSAKLVKPELTATGQFNASLMINSALKFLVLNYDLTGINAGVGPSFNVKDKVTAGQSCLETRFNFNANASAYIMLPHIEVKETYWGWYSFETSMLKNTYSVFDGTIGTYEPFSLNGCTGG